MLAAMGGYLEEVACEVARRNGQEEEHPSEASGLEGGCGRRLLRSLLRPLSVNRVDVPWPWGRPPQTLAAWVTSV